MQKLIGLLAFLTLSLFSCSNDYDLPYVHQSEPTGEVRHIAEEGVNNALGYGYDITGNYMDKHSVRSQIIDVEAFIKENEGRYNKPYAGVIQQNICAGKDAESFLQQFIEDIHFEETVAAMGRKNFPSGFFAGMILDGFQSDTKYSYASRYSFARAEVIKKQRQFFLNADVERLLPYLTLTFREDLEKYPVEKIVEKYGTHVLTNVTMGGTHAGYYKSEIIETFSDNKRKTVTAGVLGSMARKGADAFGDWSNKLDENAEMEKKNVHWHCDIKTKGGMVSFQGPNMIIDMGRWTSSVDDDHSTLVDVEWDAAYPIYEFVSDPVKKVALKKAVEDYVDSKAITVTQLLPLYALYDIKKVDSSWATSWTEASSYINQGYGYYGVIGYIYAEEVSGTVPLYRMYDAKGSNTYYLTSWDEVIENQAKGHEYQDIIGYIYPEEKEKTIPVYSLYYPKGDDSHYETVKDNADAWVRDRGDQYNGILGYIYIFD